MQYCYLEESFELSFSIYDPTDETRTVDEGTYTVYAPDGSTVQSGTLSVGEDGHTCTFRFQATTEGVNRIVLSWSMGLDRWRCPHMIDVRSI